MKYRYQCDDCFEDWISDHEELICPQCGSTQIFLEEKINDDLENEDLIDEMLILMDEEDEEDKV